MRPGFVSRSARTCERAGSPLHTHASPSTTTTSAAAAAASTSLFMATAVYHETVRRARGPSGGDVDFELSEEQQLLRETVKQFAEAELSPHAREWDEQQAFPARGVHSSSARWGSWGPAGPRSTAAPGWVPSTTPCVMEELARADAGVALSLAAHNSLCSGHIFLAGSEEQKQTLPAAARARREGRLLGRSPSPARAPTPAGRARLPCGTATTGC